MAWKTRRPKIIAELKRISKHNNGILMPEDVVANARPKSSPLHSRFTWDDTKAAQEHRLHQARQLISVCVQYIEGDRRRQVPIFVSLRKDRGKGKGGYRTLVDVMKSPTLHDLLLKDAVEEMTRFREHFKSLKELRRVRRVMAKTEKELLTQQATRKPRLNQKPRRRILLEESDAVKVKA